MLSSTYWNQARPVSPKLPPGRTSVAGSRRRRHYSVASDIYPQPGER